MNPGKVFIGMMAILTRGLADDASTDRRNRRPSLFGLPPALTLLPPSTFAPHFTEYVSRVPPSTVSAAHVRNRVRIRQCTRGRGNRQPAE